MTILIKNNYQKYLKIFLSLLLLLAADRAYCEDVTLEISTESDNNQEPLPLASTDRESIAPPPAAETNPTSEAPLPEPIPNEIDPLHSDNSSDQEPPADLQNIIGENPSPPQENPLQNSNPQSVDTPAEENKKPFDGTDFFENNSPFRSLLFSAEELEILYSTINGYRAKETIAPSVKKFIDNVAPKNETPEALPVTQSLDNLSTGQLAADDPRTQIKEFTAQTFYLKSVLMPEDKMWTLWFNDLKARSTEAKNIPGYDGLSIEKVKEQNVTFIFQEPNLDLISPDFTNILEKNKSAKWDLRSKDGKILVNSSTKKIKFTIGLGQTFAVVDMKIHEGFIAPTTVPNPYYVDPAMQGGSGNPNMPQTNNPSQANSPINNQQNRMQNPLRRGGRIQ